jgi:hypothetical protein
MDFGFCRDDNRRRAIAPRASAERRFASFLLLRNAGLFDQSQPGRRKIEPTPKGGTP